MAHDPGRRINGEGDDLLRGLVRDFLDVDAAFGRHHERHFARFAVDQDREIELLVDVGAVFDVETIDLLAVRAGLHRHQRSAQHLLGEFVDLGKGLGNAHAAFAAGGGFLEGALAAAPRVDLALHHPDRAGEALCGRIRIGCVQHRHALRDGDTEFAEQGLGLIFMDIHLDVPRTLDRGEFWQFVPAFPLAYHIPKKLQPELRQKSEMPKIEDRSWAKASQHQRPNKSGAIFLQASTRPWTAATDLSKASRSLPASSISTIRSTPLPPITTGTPTYMSFTPYSPLR